MSRNNRSLILTKKKLLALSAVFFSVGLVTSITSTLAWYAIRSEMEIGNLNLRITNTSTNLNFWLEGHKDDKNADGSPRTGGYTKNELGIENALLCDVSGMFEKQEDWKTNQGIYPKFRAAYRSSYVNTMTDYQQQETEREDGGKRINYVQNVFYFNADFDGEIYLAPVVDELEDGTTKVAPYIATDYEENVKTAKEKGVNLDGLNKVQNTVRISYFTDEGYIITQLDNHVTYYCGPLDINGDGYYDYNPDTEEEVLYGEYNQNSSIEYLPALPEDSGEAKDTFTAKHKAGIKRLDENQKFGVKEKSYCYKDYTIDTTSDNPKDYLNKKPLCTVKKGIDKRIVVSCYIEGWDKDMTDQIANATFEINIAFTALIKD